MANSGKNSNQSQFYIAFAELPQLDGKHVVFGQVTEGLDVLQRIGASLSYCPLAAAVAFSMMYRGDACSCAVQRRRWHQVTASLEHSSRLQTAECCDPILQRPKICQQSWRTTCLQSGISISIPAGHLTASLSLFMSRASKD